MENFAIGDFQDYNNPSMKDIDSSRFSPRSTQLSEDFGGDESLDRGGSLSRQSSGPDEAVFDKSSPRSSPRTSSGSDDGLPRFEEKSGSPFTPTKRRSAFRAPSSVRAMQTDITPPRMSTPSSQPRPKIYTPSRQGTPRSLRSHNSGAIRTPSKLSPSKKLKKEYPLVLLHVTLLPLPHHHSLETLSAVLPPPILANWKLLQEKSTATVLERGVLIPHPREDYDLLEERLLESLELKQPRILKCGHFHLSPEEDANILDSSSSDEDSNADDLDICADCGRRIRDGRLGDAGAGSKRWDIKIFAANGLMRAGAWAAAWREMERVDVEILPAMEERMRRELEEGRRRREEEERERLVRDEGIGGLDDERLREIYGQNVAPRSQDSVDGLVDGVSPSEPVPEPAGQRVPERTQKGRGILEAELRRRQEIPLGKLLINYVCAAAQDRRNLAILLLSAVVLFMSLRGSPSAPPLPPASGSPSVHQPPLEGVVTTPMTTAAATLPEAAASSSSQALASGPSSLLASPETSASVGGNEKEREEEKEEAEAEEGGSWTETAESVVQEILGD